jgi:anhydro-N-acetylmuramic acid kinase
MQQLQNALKVLVRPIEEIGLNGDATEAEAFAYLAVRSLRGLPLSFPMTTGVKQPMTGGKLHTAGVRQGTACN